MAEREVIESWKEIADYLKRDAKTCQRYERELGLPIHRLEDSPKARVFAYKDELEAWTARKADREARRNLRPLVLVLAAAALAAGLGLVFWHPWTGVPKGVSSLSRSRIAVLDFESPLEEAGLVDWRTGIPLLLSTDLSQSKYVSVVRNDQIRGALGESSAAGTGSLSADPVARVAKAGSAAFTATGKIMRAGDRIIIVLLLRNHVSGEAESSTLEGRSEAEISSLVDRMTVKVKEFMGLTRSQITGDRDALTVDVTTRSPEAFKLYNEGRRLHLAGETRGAIELLRAAVAKDPEFALAYRGLFAAADEIYGSNAAFPFLQRAFELSTRATPQERFWIQADFYEKSDATLDKAVEACRAWLDLYPDDVHAMHISARIFLDKEDFDRAVEYAEMSLARGGVNPYTYLNLMIAQTSSGAYEDGHRTGRLARRLMPDNALIEEGLFDNHVSSGRVLEARALLEKSSIRRSDPPGGLKACDLLILRGRYAEAGAILARRGPEERPWRPYYVRTDLPGRREILLCLCEGRLARARELARALDDHQWLAFLDYRMGLYAEGLSEAEKALAEARNAESSAGQALALQTRGQIELAMAATQAALRTTKELETCARLSPIRNHTRYLLYLEGLIESQSGRHEEAIGLFERALELLHGESWIRQSWRHAVIIDSLAAAYERSGDLIRAEAAYRRIQSLALSRLGCGDLFALSFYHLGKIAETRGRKGDAGTYYRRFLEIWKDADLGIPEVADAKKKLTAL